MPISDICPRCGSDKTLIIAGLIGIACTNCQHRWNRDEIGMGEPDNPNDLPKYEKIKLFREAMHRLDVIPSHEKERLNKQLRTHLQMTNKKDYLKFRKEDFKTQWNKVKIRLIIDQEPFTGYNVELAGVR